MSKDNENQEQEQTAEEIAAEETAALESAIDDAIVEASPHLQEDDDDDTASDDDAGTDAGDDNDEGETDSDAADDGDADDGDADEDSGDSEDSDEADDGESEGSADADEGDDVSDGTPAEPDHINDPIPETTNEKTAERIKGLIEIAKTQTSLAAERDEILQAVVDTGSTPEQYTNALGFLSMYNSDDVDTRRQALEVARGVVHELSIELGEGSADLISRHADLQAEVEAGTLDEPRAIEIATSRERQTLNESRTTHRRTTEEQQRETNDLIQEGKDQLTAFENSVANDPAYEALRPTLIGVLRTTLRTTHGSQWGATARQIFENMKKTMPAAPKPGPKPPPKTPLRAKQGAGGADSKETAAASAEEAMDRALADM